MWRVIWGWNSAVLCRMSNAMRRTTNMCTQHGSDHNNVWNFHVHIKRGVTLQQHSAIYTNGANVRNKRRAMLSLIFIRSFAHIWVYACMRVNNCMEACRFGICLWNTSYHAHLHITRWRCPSWYGSFWYTRRSMVGGFSHAFHDDVLHVDIDYSLTPHDPSNIWVF